MHPKSIKMKHLNSLVICLILSSCLAGVYGQKVEAPVAQSVIIADLGSSNAIGYFEEKTNDVWESSIKDQKLTYTETRRDQWTVYLQEFESDQSVTLNLWTQKVAFGGVEKYAVLSSSSEAVPDKYLPKESPTPVAGGGTSSNIAKGKPAKHSSQYGTQANNGAHLANDGIVQNANQGGLLHHTNKEANPWWEVDLQGRFDISSIKLYNRTNCCPERLNNFTILVSDAPFTGNFGGTTFISNQAAPRVSQEYTPAGGNTVTGRYVRLYTNQTNYMSIPEIEIFGTAASGAAPAPVANTPAPVDPRAKNKTDISNYIASLNYDARNLLAVPSTGSFETLPPGGKTTRRANGNKIIKCVKKQNKIDEKLDKISILNPNAGVIYPGALLLGDRQLAEGLPTPITLPRAPLVLSVDLPGQNQGVNIESPKNSTVQAGINGMLNNWNRNPRAQGYANPAKFTKKIQKAYSSEQLAIELGFSAEWADNSVSALAKVNTSSENEVTVAFFQQVFYTVSMDAPERPSDVFDVSKVTQADVSRVFSSQKPPAYVRSVDYGRVVMVRMETTKKATAFELESALKYAVNPQTEINANLDIDYKGIWENSSYTVYSMGGRADVAAKFVAGTDTKGLRDLIESDAVYSPSNPGVPIAYTVAWLKDNVSAGVRVSSDYVETECTEYDYASIKFEHAGAYVARIKVTWSEPNAQGVLETKVKDFGEQTSGWTQTLNLPGDAVNVKILAEAATGLVWAPWGEIINKTLPGPSNCTYRMHGTTLDRRFDEKDCR